jgi:quinoprotein glucose dehydrogenase
MRDRLGLVRMGLSAGRITKVCGPILLVLVAAGLTIYARHRARRVTATMPPSMVVPAAEIAGGQWSPGHYSRLDQINRKNVATLKVAWTYDTGEPGAGIETSPLVVGRVVYTYTSLQRIVALDAVRGKLLWKFNAGIVGTQPVRGLSYWTDGKRGYVLAGVMYFLYELDASTGKPVATFGENGRVDLRKGLRGDYRWQGTALTSPGVIYRDLILIGGLDPEAPPAPPGDIRAFDLHTGKLAWEFHTIPRPGEAGYKTWPKNAWKTAGAANDWAGMTLDAKRGIVYVPTGSAVPDFYGGARIGDDLYADCLLALNAATGKLVWYFQGVHHDLWDRDFPAAPVLLTVERDGKREDVVAQTTKQGFVFVFDRDTGKPVYPIEERRTIASRVPGEVSSRTQPFPTLPLPYARQTLTGNDLTHRTPEANANAVKQFETFVDGSEQFYPFSVGKQTIIVPGFDGGAEWGGPGADADRGILYVNTNDVAYTGGLEKNNPDAGMGVATYHQQCTLCHRDNRMGSPPEYPSLIDVDKRMTQQQMIERIHDGKGRMPPFPNLQGEQLLALLNYVRTGKDTSGKNKAGGVSRGKADPGEAGLLADEYGLDVGPSGAVPKEIAEMDRYRFTGYRRFVDEDGYPAVAPPWGTLNAIDLNTGRYLWTVPLGDYPELAAKGMGDTGSENYGGPVITTGGLVIIGATVFDKKIRAFDRGTGKLLWQYELPYAAVATPTTYMVDGKQYLVIASGGSKLTHGARSGLYVAFSLP